MSCHYTFWNKTKPRKRNQWNTSFSKCQFLLLVIFLWMLVVLCRKPVRNRKPFREVEYFCFAVFRVDQTDQAKQRQSRFRVVVTWKYGRRQCRSRADSPGSRCRGWWGAVCDSKPRDARRGSTSSSSSFSFCSGELWAWEEGRHRSWVSESCWGRWDAWATQQEGSSWGYVWGAWSPLCKVDGNCHNRIRVYKGGAEQRQRPHGALADCPKGLEFPSSWGPCITCIRKVLPDAITTLAQCILQHGVATYRPKSRESYFSEVNGGENVRRNDLSEGRAQNALWRTQVRPKSNSRSHRKRLRNVVWSIGKESHSDQRWTTRCIKLWVPANGTRNRGYSTHVHSSSNAQHWIWHARLCKLGKHCPATCGTYGTDDTKNVNRSYGKYGANRSYGKYGANGRWGSWGKGTFGVDRPRSAGQPQAYRGEPNTPPKYATPQPGVRLRI